MTETSVQLAFTLINMGIDFIKRLKAESGLTDDQLAAYADNLDSQNKDDIKKLLAL